jgi:hypothetical protein
VTAIPTQSRFPQLRHDNINLAPGSGKVLMLGMGVIGLVCLGLVLAAGATGMFGVYARHALAAYHVGAMAAMTMCLGATFFVLLFHLTNAGWSATIRRQFENVMAFLPVAFALAALTPLVDAFFGGGKLFTWMNAANYPDYLLQKKFSYFYGVGYDPEVHTHNVLPLFFFVRLLAYGVIWAFITQRLRGFSLKQDSTNDRSLSAKARFTSAWGILVMALTTAFAGFDLLMSLDFRFFSTMWGVYIFAGSMFSSVALLAFILARLRGTGKLEGAVTTEHFHDLGKFMFSFTVFWAYIAFSQYFLIWYSNIPEETAYFIWRENGFFLRLGQALVFGHFAIPFLILIFRPVKKSPQILSLMAVWAIFIHIIDLVWIIRPMAYVGEAAASDPGLSSALLVDVAGALGPVLLLGAFLAWRIPSSPLVAVNDPFMHESLKHANYV